jgi:hypothetical protein
LPTYLRKANIDKALLIMKKNQQIIETAIASYNLHQQDSFNLPVISHHWSSGSRI